MLNLRDDRTFSVENTATGDYRTFRVELRGTDEKWAPGERVLYLLKGPQNQTDYGGFAFVTIDPVDGHPHIKVWSKLRGEAGEKSAYDKMSLFLEHLSRHPNLLPSYAVYDAVPCTRCGELLTRPDSIRRGIGPVCARRAA